MPTSPFRVDDMALLRDFLGALPEKGMLQVQVLHF